MKTKVFTQFMIVLFSLCSCVNLMEIEESMGIHKGNNSSDEAILVFNIRDGVTKSSISPDETTINNINIYVFRDGDLVAYKYIEDSSPISLTLPRGYTYNLYALGNFGEYTEAQNEGSFIANCNKSITEISELGASLPMAWSKTGVELSSSHMSISMNFERLVTKIGFKLNKTSVSGLQVTSIQLKQSPSQVYPFKWESGSKIIDSTSTLDGDYASADDIAAINNGETIYFYTLENCQGTLLPQNNDPWAKIPNNLDSKHLTCTYLEVQAVFTNESPFEGEVTYRLFLGEDNCSNFDVRRNRDMNISLKITNGGLGEDSWKVETNLSIKDGSILGWIDESNRDINDQYIGNSFWYIVEATDDIAEYLGGSLEGCYYVLSSDNGAETRIDYYSYNTYKTMVARLTCTQAGTGSLWLYSSSGEPIQHLSSDIVIYPPKIVQSFYSTVNPNNNDFITDQVPECFINGQISKIHVYLADNDGYNLNTGYEYDLSIFDFTNPPSITSDFDIQETINISTTNGVEASNGPAITYNVECINPGTNAEINEKLSNAFRDFNAFSFDIEESNYALNKTVYYSIDINPIKLILVDNGWAGYFNSQLSLKVLNPSNLPLNIDIWEVNTANNFWYKPTRDEIVDFVESSLIIKRAKYITNVFYNSYEPIYGSVSNIRSERNITGTTYIIDGEYIVHPIDSIKTAHIYNALTYDYMGQETLHHLFDVSLGSNRLLPSDINVIDELSDGSIEFDILYGDEPGNPGWNNQGIWLWSKDSFIRQSNYTLNTYTNISALNLSRFSNRMDNQGIYKLNIAYNPNTGTLQAYSEDGNKYNISLDFRYSGIVNGYVKTYPNGKAFGGKDNYCSAIINKTVTGVSVGSYSTTIDNGGLKAAMNAIYAQTFFDSHNWIGSANNYQHAAHPISIELKMEVKLTSGSDWYPIDITFLDETIPYYHFQDNVIYNPTFEKYWSSFSFAEVQRR